MIDETHEELASLYVLDLLEGLEKQGFETLMARDPELRKLVAELRDAAAPLAHLAPPATPPPELKTRLLAEIAAPRQPKKQAEAILGNMVDLVVKNLKKGDRIRIGGLGILQVRKRAARMGRNPATGEPIKIKASKKVAFRAAKELKEAV